MIVSRLKLANLRAIEAAEFRFQPGMNLIVGVNGVGKTSVLDALRICLSRVLPAITPSRTRAIAFKIDDIRVGFPFLDATMYLNLGEGVFRFTRLEWRQDTAVDDPENLERLRRKILETERLQDRPRKLLRDLESTQSVADCDTRKGDRDLQWSPANPAHRIETRLRYEPDGSIRSNDADFDRQLEEVLNLNLPVLKNNRQGVLDAILDWWRREKAKLRGPVPRTRFENERARLAAGPGDLAEYCQVAVWWLDQRLARMTA
jgi:hypothetical protein